MKSGYVYIIKSNSFPHGICKIGKTMDLKSRKNSLQAAIPHKIETVALFKVDDIDSYEFKLQNLYRTNNLIYDGGREWYFIPQDHQNLAEILSDEKSPEVDSKHISSNKNIDSFINTIKARSSERIFRYKRADVDASAVFRDNKFFLLKGSIISASDKEEIDRKNKSNNNLIIKYSKKLREKCKLMNENTYVLLEDLDISNNRDASLSTSKWTQGISRSSQNWFDAWMFTSYTVKEMKEKQWIDFPSGGTNGDYKWIIP